MVVGGVDVNDAYLTGIYISAKAEPL
jgi:hypothetical protein